MVTMMTNQYLVLPRDGSHQALPTLQDYPVQRPQHFDTSNRKQLACKHVGEHELVAYLEVDHQEYPAETNTGFNPWFGGCGDAFVRIEANPKFDGTPCATVPVPASMWPDVCLGIADIKHRTHNSLVDALNQALNDLIGFAFNCFADRSNVKSLALKCTDYLTKEFKHPHAEVVYSCGNSMRVDSEVPQLLVRSMEALVAALDGLQATANKEWVEGGCVLEMRKYVLPPMLPYHFDDPTLSLAADAQRLHRLLAGGEV